MVSTGDLARLKASSEKGAEERYREALKEAGLMVSWPDPAKRTPRKRRRLIEVKGIPLSEQVIRDRR